MVSSITPTVIKILVPPKNWATAKLMFHFCAMMVGSTAIKARKTAPAKVIRLIA